MALTLPTKPGWSSASATTYTSSLGSERNIKITRPADMELARFYLERERAKSMSVRCGSAMTFTASLKAGQADHRRIELPV